MTSLRKALIKTKGYFEIKLMYAPFRHYGITDWVKTGPIAAVSKGLLKCDDPAFLVTLPIVRSELVTHSF